MNTVKLLMDTSFDNPGSYLRFDEDFFYDIVELISGFLDFPEGAELSLVLCEDDEIRTLNREYRNIDAPTDVLSFPMFEDSMLGDIVISMQTAAAQAAGAGIPLEREAAFLFIHGFLHLCGYDHEAGEKEEAEMFLLQEEILAKWVEKYE